jgi:large subunit ribosomal protein L24
MNAVQQIQKVKMKIRKGDTVAVLTGRDKGKTGEVLRVIPADNRVLVQGVNTVKRHTKAKPGQTGGIVEKENPIHASNVALVDPKDKKPTRVGFKVIDGKKMRFARRSGEIIDR